MDLRFLRSQRTPLVLFAIGVAVAVVVLLTPGLRHLILEIDRLGYLGILLGGVLYGSAVTATTAILIFVQADHGLNPLLVGVIGGLGAALYDTTVFLLVRRESNRGWLAERIARLRARRRVPDALTFALAGLIIASPLPDELASGLIGVTNGRTLPFLGMSFAANAVGIALLSRI